MEGRGCCRNNRRNELSLHAGYLSFNVVATPCHKVLQGRIPEKFGEVEASFIADCQSPIVYSSGQVLRNASLLLSTDEK